MSESKQINIRLDEEARKHLSRVTSQSEYIRMLLDSADRELDDAISFVGRMAETERAIEGEDVATVIDVLARASAFSTGIIAPSIVSARVVMSSTTPLQKRIDASPTLALALLVLARQIARGDARARLFVEGLRTQTKKEGKKK